MHRQKVFEEWKRQEPPKWISTKPKEPIWLKAFYTKQGLRFLPKEVWLLIADQLRTDFQAKYSKVVFSKWSEYVDTNNLATLFEDWASMGLIGREGYSYGCGRGINSYAHRWHVTYADKELNTFQHLLIKFGRRGQVVRMELEDFFMSATMPLG
jgi:hypothetical protein